MFSPEDFKLSFSTVVAPELTVPQLAESARSCGYHGIELHMSGPEGPAHAHGIGVDAPPASLAEARHALADAGIEVSCIATDLAFEGSDESAVTDAVDRLKRYVALAETLGCRYVRVLGGSLSPDLGEVAGLVDGISDALAEAVTYAEQTNASILLETRGGFSSTKYVREVVKQVYSDRFGVLWAVAHLCRALETVEESYDNISGQVRLVHVHDYRYVDGRLKTQPAALGEGVVPFGQAIEYLAHDGFEGYLSVDTSQGPAEEVLLQHSQALHDLVTKAFPEPVEAE
jgi:sugar phosphate isomerase/epimerase